MTTEGTQLGTLAPQLLTVTAEGVYTTEVVYWPLYWPGAVVVTGETVSEQMVAPATHVVMVVQEQLLVQVL